MVTNVEDYMNRLDKMMMLVKDNYSYYQNKYGNELIPDDINLNLGVYCGTTEDRSCRREDHQDTYQGKMFYFYSYDMKSDEDFLIKWCKKTFRNNCFNRYKSNVSGEQGYVYVIVGFKIN